MNHKTNKIKFKDGQDANTMLMRKLMYNFLQNSSIKTTEAKGKALKMYIDRLVSKSKERTEANKNYILRFFPDKKIVNVLFDQVGPAIAKVNGGFVRVVRLNKRLQDATMMVEVQWAHPVVIDWEDKKKPAKVSTKKAVKDTKVSEVTK